MVEPHILNRVSINSEDFSTLQQVHRSSEHSGFKEKVSGENREANIFGTIRVY